MEKQKWLVCILTYLSNVIVFIGAVAECPSGMVYQQCGSLCPQTCDNVGASNCHGGCAEGCFCPDGQVVYNGRCVHPIVCPGLYKD